MRRGMIGCIAGACALALTSGTALARAGDRTFTDTYPVAAQLCAGARTGQLSAQLVANRAGVVAACDTLQNAFGPLVSTVDAAESTYLTAISQQRDDVATACAKPVANPAACQAARSTRLTSDMTALQTRQSAVDTFHSSVEQNRLTFWSTVQGLRASS